MSIILKALKKIQNQEVEQPPGVSADGLGKGEEQVADAAVSPASPAPMDGMRAADVDEVPAHMARSQAGQGRLAELQVAEGRHRFGVTPTILIGLIVALGIFATGWFVSNIYFNFKLVGGTEETEPQADAEQPRQFTRTTQVIPPKSQPAVASVSAQTPALATDETTLPVAPRVQEKTSETVVSETKPQQPEQARPMEKEAKPQEEGRPELKINAIAWRAREPKAVVNMQSVYVGDVIEGATVVAIRRKNILFEYDGETFQVRF